MARYSTPGPGLERAKSRDIKVLRHVLRFLRPYTPQVIGASVALLVTAGATLAIGRGLGGLIDRGFGAEAVGALEQALLFLMILGLVIAAGSFMRYYLMTWLGERVVADIRNAVFERVIYFDQGFFEITRTGEILSRLTTDTTLLQTVVGSSMSMAIRNFILMIGGIAMMFLTNAKLAALSLILVPVVVLPVLILGRRVRALSKANQDRVADVGAFAEETLSGIHTVQAFTHETKDIVRFRDEVANAFSTALKRARIRSVLNATVTIVVFFGIGTVLWVGGGDVIAGRISGGDLGAFIFYAMMVALSAGIVSEVYGDLQRAAGATERLVELLETQPGIRTPEMPQVFKKYADGVGASGRVVFDTVTFNYPSRPDLAALKEFSLTVEPGETVALVGPSGAGKSTVFELLYRFYDPAVGRITLDGVCIADADPVEVRRRLALVPQEPFLFGETAFSNIQYGRPDASRDEVVAAARDAMADEFISDLPDGYDSYLGERGIRLSGGQRQRISIARAILRNPSVLLLDEATSALDAENERLVQNGLQRLMAGRTTLIIAHRLSTVINADRIVVLNKGAIEAIGTHDELLHKSSLYKKLADLQFFDSGSQVSSVRDVAE